MIYRIKSFGELKQVNSYKEDDWAASDALTRSNIRTQLFHALDDQMSDLYEYLTAPLNKVMLSNKVFKVHEDGSVEWDFEASRALTDKEIKVLLKNHDGQCSDGMGEGFEQYPFAEERDISYFYSPWSKGTNSILVEVIP